MFKIYHNPRCRKSREGLKYLQENNIDHEVVLYLDGKLNEDILKELLLKLNSRPQDIIRKQEEIFRKELKGKNFTDDEWLLIILENPRLLQRPIVTAKHKAVLAQPPEKIKELL